MSATEDRLVVSAVAAVAPAEHSQALVPVDVSFGAELGGRTDRCHEAGEAGTRPVEVEGRPHTIVEHEDQQVRPSGTSSGASRQSVRVTSRIQSAVA